MVSKVLLAALALTAFLATVPLSAADCIKNCQSTIESCPTKCSTDESCTVKCVKDGIRCACNCPGVLTRKMSTTTSAEEYRNAILRFASTRSDASDLLDCIDGATTDAEFCACGAASLQAGILVALAALLSWLH